jgi:hypothetical protein
MDLRRANCDIAKLKPLSRVLESSFLANTTSRLRGGATRIVIGRVTLDDSQRELSKEVYYSSESSYREPILQPTHD